MANFRAISYRHQHTTRAEPFICVCVIGEYNKAKKIESMNENMKNLEDKVVIKYKKITLWPPPPTSPHRIRSRVIANISSGSFDTLYILMYTVYWGRKFPRDISEIEEVSFRLLKYARD